jgi:2-dehydro-3-deoxyphosphogluconate aldolase / (4S)-4-hydroxy-2-oxoglutarate aldolase
MLGAMLAEAPILAIIRTTEPEKVPEIAAALVDGGIRALEISLSVPDALRYIESTARTLGDHVALGAGTVRTPDDARRVADAGAQFIVTPMFSAAILEIANAAGLPVVCGAMTPTEIQAALEAGAQFVKLFPAGPLGLNYLREVLVPFAEAPIVPTGGIAIDEVSNWRLAGAAAIGMGGSLVPRESVLHGKWDEITTRAKAAIDAALTTGPAR